MYYDFGDNLEANLEVFVQAESVLRRSLDDHFASEYHDSVDHWITDTHLATNDSENIRLTYLAWREARSGIDAVREKIVAKKDKVDKES